MSDGDKARDDGPHEKQRAHTRTDLSLLVQYRFNTFEDFLAEYAVNLSPGGMFIHTADPAPLGSTLELQFSLKDGSKLIEGLAKVVRVIPAGGSTTPGMGVQFLQFDDETLALIEQICRSRGKVPSRE